jgi:hypothetical protein
MGIHYMILQQKGTKKEQFLIKLLFFISSNFSKELDNNDSIISNDH